MADEDRQGGAGAIRKKAHAYNGVYAVWFSMPSWFPLDHISSRSEYLLELGNENTIKEASFNLDAFWGRQTWTNHNWRREYTLISVRFCPFN